MWYLSLRVSLLYAFGIERLLIPTVGGDIFGTLKLNNWPVMCRLSWKTFLLNPSVFISRGALIGGSSLLNHVGNPFSNTCCTVLIVPNYAEM